MRQALVVGIDYYKAGSPLYGCVNDAHNVKAVIERHGDGSVNFAVKLLTGTGPSDTVSRVQLKDHVRQLFESESETVLFYFAGHGHIEASGGYLLASDSTRGDEGMPLSEILLYANKSKARNKVIVLDSCHSGIAGTPPDGVALAELADGLTIMTASTAEQYADEVNGSGVFTGLFVDAMNGSAANLVGDVTPGSVYAHIDQSLGPWEQRPVFKTNVKSFVSLRTVQPPIPTSDLRRIAEFFPVAGHQYPLDPTYEPESGVPDPTNTAIFSILQRLNRVNLVVPVGAVHMYNAAMESRSCKLTVLGEHYRQLVARGRL
jgi:hypothetical protein